MDTWQGQQPTCASGATRALPWRVPTTQATQVKPEHPPEATSLERMLGRLAATAAAARPRATPLPTSGRSDTKGPAQVGQ